MKKIILLNIILLFSFSLIIGQSSFCGTTYSGGGNGSTRNEMGNRDDFCDDINDASTSYKIPIVFHVIKDEGNANPDLPSDFSIQNMLDEANSLLFPYFELVPINHFNPCNGNFIKRPQEVYNTMYAMPGGNELEIKNLSRVDPETAVNVWLVRDLYTEVGETNGFAYFPFDVPAELDGIVIKKAFINGGILAHEFGHYLGLYHLWGNEAWDENNCHSEEENCMYGDHVADTEPCRGPWPDCIDPNNEGICYGCGKKFDWDDIKDLWNNPYCDSEENYECDNIMSYSYDYQAYLSTGQFYRMIRILNEERPELPGWPLDVLTLDYNEVIASTNSGWWVNTNVIGAKTIDIWGSVYMENSTLHIEDGGEIILHPGSRFVSVNSTITTCGENWKGIKVVDESGSSAEIRIEAGSIIEKANIGVKMVGKTIFVSEGDVEKKNIFRDNITDIYLDASNSCDLKIHNTSFENTQDWGLLVENLEDGVHAQLDIENCDFTNINQAITFWNCEFLGLVNDINDCHFNNNSNSIYLGGSEGIFIKNCEFEEGINEILLEYSNSIYLENNSFTGGRNGILANNSTAIDVKGCDFQDFTYTGSAHKAGILSIDSKMSIHNGNNFINCETGVNAMGSYGDHGSVTIQNDNYFYGCIEGVSLTGVTDYGGALIEDNMFEDNDHGIKVFGDNHFTVLDNMLTNDYNVLVTSSGANGINSIMCNEHMGQGSGIQLDEYNPNTDFIGNTFSYTGFYDVIVDGTINDIGNSQEPALNMFSPYGGDISVVQQANMFTYYLPNSDVDYTDPKNDAEIDIPEEWEFKSENNGNSQCGIQIPPVINPNTVIIYLKKYCELLKKYNENPNKANEKKVNVIKRILIKYFYHIWKHIGIDISKEQVEIFLKYGCERWFTQKKLYNLYVQFGDFEKAEAMLAEIGETLNRPALNNRLDSIDRASKKTFLATQRIGLRYQKRSLSYHRDSVYVFTEAEIDTLRVHAMKLVPEAANARALLFIATGETVPDNWIIPNEEYVVAMPVASNETELNRVFGIYPNPTESVLFIDFANNDNNTYKLSIKDIIGKIVFSREVQSNNKHEIDVSNFDNGLYFISLENMDTGELNLQKFVVTHSK